MSELLGWVFEAAVLMLRVVVWALGQWVRLCVGWPMRVWWWIWRRPLPLWRRLYLALGPWLLLGLLAAPWLVVRVGWERPRLTPELRVPYVMVAPAARLERQALASVLAGVSAFASPWDLEEAPARVARARYSRLQKPAMRTPAEILARRAVVLVVGLVVFPFTVSLVLGGPVFLPVLLVVRGWPGGARTVSGRALRRVPARRFPAWRKKGDRRRTWFVGASATSRGPLWLAPEARLMHTWVVGATGTGKTQSVLLPALRSDILAGRPAVFIDGKGDRETLSAIWSFAREARREKDLRCFDLRHPEQSHSYSPLLNGTPNEQADKIMAALRWDNEYYRTQSKAALLRVLRSLNATSVPYSLDDVLAALSDLAALRALEDSVDDDHRAELEQIAGRWKDHLVESSGMRSQLEALLMTDFGELLKVPRPTLDLAEAYQGGAIVYFALPVARFPETAPLVAKLVISDLNSVAGLVQDGQLERGFASIVIDEFAAFAMPLFVDLLNKGRSAGMAITISHQSMRGDLAAAERGFVDQVADNTNIKICLRQSADAEYVAGLSGTFKTTKRTEQTQAALLGHDPTGLGSAREVDEYHVSPNLIRQLPQGYAVVQVNAPATLDLVRLDHLDTSRLPPYSPPAQGRAPSTGIDLRRRVVRRGGSSPLSAPPATMTFEGA